jgi:hypothetical protein
MNAHDDGGSAFDQFLERELQRRVGALQGPRPEVRQAVYRVAAIGGKSMPLLSSLAAAASSKAAIGLATAALVVGGGSVAAAAATGSTDPGTWGKTVTQAVANCKSKLGDNEHGIGQCVSAVASRKGQEERAAHAASGARMNEAAPSPHATGSGQSHPTPDAQHSKPSGVPAGPPSAAPAGDGSHPTGPPVVPPTPHH